MDRNRILNTISREQLGIEIGPWFSPIAPKKDGYNCLSLDVYPTEILKRRAASDKNIEEDQRNHIEEVDLIGSSAEIASIAEEKGLTGKIDYIISSHNLEHIPNPVKFLQGCASTLKVGGVLSMMVPDKRACFDHFRPHTTLGDWLEAYFEGRAKPTLKQVFEAHQLGGLFNGNGGFDLTVTSADITPTNNIFPGYVFWVDQVRTGDKNYNDTHCWTLTPTVFELLILDLAQLGLVKLKLDHVTDAEGCEFHTRLINMGTDWSPEYSNDEYFSIRTGLIKKAHAEQFVNASLSSDRTDISALKQENYRLVEKLVKMENSTSWRITAPLRKIKTIARSLISK
jgi:SAM-dependent methyltransferase